MRLTAKGDGAAMQTASRFLGEIPDGLVQEWNLRSGGAGEWD
jgi:hypothetical protein